MGDLVEFPFGARRAPAPVAQLTSDLVGGDEAKTRTVDGSICAAYVEMLDDLLARHDALARDALDGSGHSWLAALGRWIVEAHKLRAEIARRPVNIRMAVGIAERAGRLAGLIAALEQQRAKHVDQADGLMAEARSVNEDFKQRLISTEPHRAAVRPPSAPPAEAHAVRVTEPLSVLTRSRAAILVRRNAAWMEACSVVFHLRNAAVAFGNLFRAAFAVPENPLVHRPRLSDVATLGGARRRVTRKDAAQFRASGLFPPDGSAA